MSLPRSGDGRRKGIVAYKDLADMLTGKIKMPRGADRWQATQVKRIIERAVAVDPQLGR